MTNYIRIDNIVFGDLLKGDDEIKNATDKELYVAITDGNLDYVYDVDFNNPLTKEELLLHLKISDGVIECKDDVENCKFWKNQGFTKTKLKRFVPPNFLYRKVKNV